MQSIDGTFSIYHKKVLHYHEQIQDKFELAQIYWDSTIDSSIFVDILDQF